MFISDSTDFLNPSMTSVQERPKGAKKYFVTNWVLKTDSKYTTWNLDRFKGSHECVCTCKPILQKLHPTTLLWINQQPDNQDIILIVCHSLIAPPT